jgi:hypothetical protein
MYFVIIFSAEYNNPNLEHHFNLFYKFVHFIALGFFKFYSF